MYRYRHTFLTIVVTVAVTSVVFLMASDLPSQYLRNLTGFHQSKEMKQSIVGKTKIVPTPPINNRDQSIVLTKKIEPTLPSNDRDQSIVLTKKIEPTLPSNDRDQSIVLTKKIEPTLPTSDTDILTKLLLEKLSLPPAHNVTLPKACYKKETLANSCKGKCLQMEIPTDVRKRVSQIVDRPELQMTPGQHQILRDMAKKLTGQYDIIFATAASSNHFNESQAMIKALHENMYPHLKNFTLIYYNLGLTPQERERLVKGCKCHVLDFPFEKFPSFFKNLRCYTWKPMIIKAHIQQANTLIWADASVRFDKGIDKFRELLERVRKHDHQFGGPDSVDAPIRTVPSMYHFFGDEPCAYLGMGEVYATYSIQQRSFYIERLFLEPWVACAFDRRCMCPVPRPSMNKRKRIKMRDDWKAGKGPLVYGLVHRFDQSAQGLIIQKLYRNRFQDVLMSPDAYLSTRREEKIPNYL